LSEASRQAVQRRIALGFDPPTGDYILSLEDVIEAKIGLYSKNTLLNIIDWYKERVKALQNENRTLREELKALARQ